jgi:SAM-dependent methyltransferase
MIKLINPIDCVERALSASGLHVLSHKLECKDQDYYMYGGGPFKPGQAFDGLIEKHREGKLLGTVALWFTEHSVSAYDGDTRAHVGAILRLASPIYVPDKFTVDSKWNLHYACQCAVGGLPAWWADPAVVNAIDKKIAAESVEYAAGVCASVGEVILACRADRPFRVHVEHPWGSAHNLAHLDLSRFIEQVGLTSYLRKDGVLQAPPANLANTERKRALDTVRDMVDTYKKRTANDKVATVMNAWAAAGIDVSDEDRAAVAERLGATPIGSVPRELVLGSEFDPATHYTKEYYGGEAGLRFTKPDGSKDIYHGPGHDWEGLRTAALILRSIKLDAKNLLDLGCGSGAFVKYALEQEFDAYGVDISQEAINHATPVIKSRLMCEDITKSLHAGQYDIVTALDFWEHIFLSDIPSLLTAVRRMLKPGGIGFFVICTHGNDEKDWTIARGDVFTKENSWLLASGHVTVRRWGWWLEAFESNDFIERPDLAYAFQVARDEDAGLRTAESWRSRNLLIVEKP